MLSSLEKPLRKCVKNHSFKKNQQKKTPCQLGSRGWQTGKIADPARCWQDVLNLNYKDTYCLKGKGWKRYTIWTLNITKASMTILISDKIDHSIGKNSSIKGSEGWQHTS